MGDKGNIRVAVRLRGLNQSELNRNETTLWSIKEQKTISQLNSSIISFSFDRVFDGLEDNEAVYNEICSPIVEKVLQGFNGTIFAYGQTSSGKTYTMMGDEDQSISGVLHHTIEHIFNSIQEMEKEREFLLRVSFMEIYNEMISDLLSNKKKLKMQDYKYGFIKIDGLTELTVQTPEQVLVLMKKGQNRRRTEATACNEKSSRSHSIFRMILESRMRNVEDGAVNVSQLNLVDLAGSERVDQARTKGERFKESVSINKSLFMLSQVISQLSEHQDHFVNFRNSTLTRLLQNSLGGNALTAIICTVHPTSLKQTLSTLKFASRAKNIKNKPHVNEIITDKAEIKRYENDLKLLNQELEASKMQNKKLEEKNKKNEILEQEIERLREKLSLNLFSEFLQQRNTSSQIKNRRLTWGGGSMRKELTSIPAFRKPLPSLELPTLEEENDPEQESEVTAASEILEDISYFKIPRESQSFSPTRRSSILQKLEDAAVQTDFNEMDKNIAFQTKGDFNLLKDNMSQTEENACFKKDSTCQVDLTISTSEKCTCEFYEKYQTLLWHTRNIESELGELQLFTNQERQVTFDELNELMQVVKKKMHDSEACAENIAALKARYESSKADWNAKTAALVKELEDKYEKEMTDQENKFYKDMNTKITELKEQYLEQEREKKEEYKIKILELEDIHDKEMIEQEKDFNKRLNAKIYEIQKENMVQDLIKNDDYNRKIEELKYAHELDKIDQQTKFIKDMCIKDEEFQREIQAFNSAHQLQLQNLEIKLSEDTHGKLLELKEEHLQQEMDKNAELQSKVQELQEMLENTVSVLKTEHEKQIKDLELRISEDNSEKLAIKSKIENNKREMFAVKMKYEGLLDKYKRKCKQELEIKTNEIDDLKAKLAEAKNGSLAEMKIQQLQTKLTDITTEKDSVFKEYSMLKQQLGEVENNFKQVEAKLYEQINAKTKDFKLEIKAIEERNKNLTFELDQKKAKITTLEHNNSNLVKELAKYKERSSKHGHVASKTETEIPNSVKKMQINHHLDIGRKGEETRNMKMPQAPTANFENIQGIQSELPDHEKALLLGGTGPVNVVKVLFLEKELSKKDKEIAKLKNELLKLQTCAKTTQHAKACSKPKNDMKQPLQVVDDIVCENVTEKIYSDLLHPYPPGAIPKVMHKRILREKNVKYPVDEPENKPSIEKLPQSVTKSKNEALEILAGDSPPNCKQQ